MLFDVQTLDKYEGDLICIKEDRQPDIQQYTFFNVFVAYHYFLPWT